MSLLPRKKYSLAADPHRSLKWCIWGYFLLLIFEGALRRWFLPAFSDMLLVVRDPIAIWLIVYSIYRRVFVPGQSVVVVWLIGLAGFVAALLSGHGSLVVAIYGVRILLIYFPLMFVIGRIFTREDVLQMGRITLLLSIPMTVLIAAQFHSPQSAWVNRGLAGDVAGAGFGGANGYMRPAGTFSFITGTAAFYSLAACFVWYFWFNTAAIRRWLLVAATVCLMCAIPLSISRTLAFQMALTSLFAMVCAAAKPKSLVRLIIALFAVVLIFFIARGIPFFGVATDAFYSRFVEANHIEGGLRGTIGERAIGAVFRAVDNARHEPFWGCGIGQGTNAGSSILTGNRAFLVAEDEWGRVVGELGALLGLAFMLTRVWVAIKLLRLGCIRFRCGDYLPWILASFACVMLVIGQWAQPTLLGFGALIVGMALAATKKQPE